MGYFTEDQLKTITAQDRPPPGAMQSQPSPSFSDKGTFSVPDGTFKDTPGTFMPDGSRQQKEALQGRPRPIGGGSAPPPGGMPPSLSARPRRPLQQQQEIQTPTSSKLALGMPSPSLLDDSFGNDEI